MKTLSTTVKKYNYITRVDASLITTAKLALKIEPYRGRAKQTMSFTFPGKSDQGRLPP